ncbi:MAG: hypothetical protein RLZZ232_998 [Planctomycetota bacterium]
MLIDRSHLPWGLFSATVLGVGAVTYVMYAAQAPHGPSGGTVPGLWYGVIATGMLLCSALLAVRRPLRRWRLGSLAFWLRGHIWLGGLCVPFLMFHSGFSWGGTVSWLLWLCVLFVVGSGLLGLGLQQVLPRVLRATSKAEIMEAPSAYQRDRLLVLADLRMSDVCCRPQPNLPERLQEAFAVVMRDFERSADSTLSRSEQHSRRMHVLRSQQPPEFRDFLWTLSRAARHELRLIAAETDFPELLKKTYPQLQPLPASPGGDASTLTQVSLTSGNSGSGTADEGFVAGRPRSRDVPGDNRGHADLLWQFYISEVRSFLAGTSSIARRSDDVLGAGATSQRIFQRQREVLNPSLHGPLQELQALCDYRRAMDQQRRILLWMNLWMLLHVPVSGMLLVLLLAHIVMSLRVVPW